MTALSIDDAAEMLRELSEPAPYGDKVKRAIDRAAHAAGLSYWRAFDLWYRKARRVEDFEIFQLNEALRIKRERAAANELHDLKTRIARLEATLATRSTNSRREAVDRTGIPLRGVGGMDRALAGRGGR